MDQCAGLTLRQPFERFGGPRFVARQLLAPPQHPSDQGPVHTPPDRLERRAVEMAVILLPSPQDRSEHGREISQALVVHQLAPPSPNFLPQSLSDHGLGRYQGPATHAASCKATRTTFAGSTT